MCAWRGGNRCGVCMYGSLAPRLALSSHLTERVCSPEAAERLGLTPRVCTPEAPEQLVIQPVRRIEGHIKLPGSKSLSNRVLLLAALAEGTTVVRNLLVRHPARAELARPLTRFELCARRRHPLRTHSCPSSPRRTARTSGTWWAP